MSDFMFPNDQPVVLLDCEKAFNALTEQEKRYAHFLSRASWYGGLIVLLQTSLESPLIYSLLHKLFRSQSIPELKKVAVDECGFTEDDFTGLLVYTSGILSNMGNYKGFGDTKFIPNLSKEKFVKLFKASKAYSLHKDEMKKLLTNCCDAVFSIEDKEKQLGFPNLGVTSYFSRNCTEEDSNIVKQFLKTKNLEAYNSRVFKVVNDGTTTYEIRLASVLTPECAEDMDLLGNHASNGHKFVISRGDYSKLLENVNKSLEQAMKYAANENEEQMIKNYIHSFRTGSLDAHKNGSRFWIKDKGPVVETYIGFIETYRDPAGMRGEFEGFVAMVNKPMSQKFTELVNQAENFLPLLPWPKNYEKDTFLRPDFTSLDVLTFSGSGIPAGICIPNYEEIKQNEGFKNVSLGNVIPASYKGTAPNFLKAADQELLEKYRVGAFEVQVGLHELLGHGSGKLFKRNKDGSFNFNKEELFNVLTNEKLSSWYEEGDTFDSIFTSLGSSYEECRAECVGLHLSVVPEVLKIFGFEGEEADDVMYVNWLSMCHKGVEGLQTYEPKPGVWLQAHSQARYVILRVLLEAGEGFVHVEKLTGADGQPDLLLTLDRQKILTVGKPAIAKFLQKLQVYKATADRASAQAMYDKYSAVTSDGPYPFLNYREIVMSRKKPKKMFVEANTLIKDGKVHLKQYESSHEGMIKSWIDRFVDEDLDKIVEELCEKDRSHFA